MNSDRDAVPTPYEWVGGAVTFDKLTTVFYAKVMQDDVLEPVFRHMSADHSRHVAAFLAESFGGPASYSAQHGDQTMVHVIQQHLQRHLTEAHRQRWMSLILQSADEIGMPEDPEFRGVLVGHLEWGTRFAVLMSRERDNPMGPEDRVPQFRWGDFGGPYGTVEPIFRRKND
jgi:hemoglobin